MANKHGDFIWYELLTGDMNGAAAFYSDVLGWKVEQATQSDKEYRLWISRDEETGEEHQVGGFTPLTEEMQKGWAKPIWLGYIGVEDVGLTIGKIVAAGGKVLIPTKDLSGVGAFAMVTDPQGIPFYVMRGTGDESLAFENDKPRPGHCAWNELATPDPKAALAFYTEQFGWQKDGEMDLGPLGFYEFIRHGGMIGGLMSSGGEGLLPMWTYYFRVVDIDAAAERVRAAGGQVFQDPIEVPDGEWVINGIDPQGTLFALVGGRS